MKKILIFIIAIFILFAFSACQKKSPIPEQKGPTSLPTDVIPNSLPPAE